MTVSDVSGPFRKAFRDGCITAVADPQVFVCLGHPGKGAPPDVVMVGDITSTQDFGAMTPNRQRELIITQELVVSCTRGGPQATEDIVSDRAFLLLNRIEEYYRGDGTPAGNARTTLGGLVRECFCVQAGPAGGLIDIENLAKGREMWLPALFRARVRITS